MTLFICLVIYLTMTISILLRYSVTSNITPLNNVRYCLNFSTYWLVPLAYTYNPTKLDVDKCRFEQLCLSTAYCVWIGCNVFFVFIGAILATYVAV